MKDAINQHKQMAMSGKCAQDSTKKMKCGGEVKKVKQGVMVNGCGCSDMKKGGKK